MDGGDGDLNRVDSNDSMKPDPSLVSFVNSTNNLNDDDPDFEVTFYNESLTQILSKIDL